MTRSQAIELVKKDLIECGQNNVSNIVAIADINKSWKVTCKLDRPEKTPIGQDLDTIRYCVTNDGTVLCYPE